jgi:hypothetical protein
MKNTIMQFSKIVLLSVALCILPAAGFAANAEDFTNESIAGKYAIVQTGKGGRAVTAGVGVVEADAQGNMNGYIIVNTTDTQSGARKFTEIPLSLTYLIHPDGTGRITLRNAPIKEAAFTVTRAEQRFARFGGREYPGGKVALEISVIGKEPGELQGNLITVTLTRMPADNNGFTNASLVGKYAINVVATGGTPATAAAGSLTDDEEGNFLGRLVFNIVDPLTGERRFIELPTGGSFTVNPDGTGKIIFSAGAMKEAVFVITKAERRFVRVGNLLLPREMVALETALIAKEPGDGGHLLTGTATRLPE